MNYEKARRQIISDYCNLFLAKYMKGKWGMIAGFKTVVDYVGIVRKQLLDWQESQDCSNSLCAESKLQVMARRCPPGYFYVGPGIIASKPNGACIINNAIPPIDPINPDVTLISSPVLATPGACIVNPPLCAKGKSNWFRHHMNVNEILINTFGTL